MSRSLRRPARAPSYLERLGAWVETLPAFWQPPAIGAGFVLAFMAGKVARRASLLLLIALAVGVAREGLRVLLAVPLVFAIGALAGACGGLAYSAVGRTLQRIPGVGTYLTGYVVVGAYLAVALELLTRLHLVRARYAVAWSDPTRSLAYGFCVLLFGTIFGYALAEGARTGRRPWRQRPQRVTSRVPPAGT